MLIPPLNPTAVMKCRGFELSISLETKLITLSNFYLQVQFNSFQKRSNIALFNAACKLVSYYMQRKKKLILIFRLPYTEFATSF